MTSGWRGGDTLTCMGTGFRLATVTPGGTPHLVPVVFAPVDDALYSADA